MNEIIAELNEMRVTVPFGSGHTLALSIRSIGAPLTREHIAAIRRYLALAEADLLWADGPKDQP